MSISRIALVTLAFLAAGRWHRGRRGRGDRHGVRRNVCDDVCAAWVLAGIASACASRADRVMDPAPRLRGRPRPPGPAASLTQLVGTIGRTRIPSWSAVLASTSILMTCAAASGQTVRGILSEQDTYVPIDLGTVVLLTTALDTLARTITDERGFFSITWPAAGEYYLVASALGYRSVRSEPVSLEEGAVTVVELAMRASPVPLSGLLVEAEGAAPEIPGLVGTGFYERAAEGRGEFLFPGEIAASTATYTQQLFWGTRLVRVHQTSRPGPWNDALRIPNRAGPGYCEPAIYVDGVRLEELLPGESIADVAPKGELEAVEIYDGVIWIPPAYRHFQDCGLILFWTRAR